MAINQNHLFEELDGIKCAIVEKNVSPQRADFLRNILELNRYTVVVIPSPPAKLPAAKPAPATDIPLAQPEIDTPITFTVGVTDVTFNPVNAIFGRLLKAPGGQTITLNYWHQREAAPNEDKPYFES